MAKEGTMVHVKIVERKFKKYVTVISGISEDADLKQIMKKLKEKLACGGTYKDGNIELQGDHRERIKSVLVSLGFAPDQIEVE